MLNIGSAVLGVVSVVRGRSVVVDAIGSVGGLAVIGTERGTVGPSYGRSRNERTEWNLAVPEVIKPRENSRKISRLLTVKVSGKNFPSRKTVNVTESLRGSDWLANCPQT